MAVVTGLAGYLVLNSLLLRQLGDHLMDRGLLKTLAYLCWMAAGFVVFMALVTTAGRAVLASSFLVFFVSLATNYSYTAVFKNGGLQQVTSDAMDLMVENVRQAPMAWTEFRAEVLRGMVEAAVVLAVFLAIRLAVRRHRSFPGSWLSQPSARRLALAAFLGIQGLAILLQPYYAMAETNTFVFALQKVLTLAPHPRDVPVSPVRQPLSDKIVLIVDESVTHGAYRDVVEARLRGLPAYDFGEAASMANCSAASNALLRWGIERPSVGKAGYDPRSNPMIWRFASSAGFRTVLIDGQSRGVHQNYLGSEEFSNLDEFVAADDGLETDRAVATMLNERLQRAGRDFIYVVKRGAHFPYEQGYATGEVPEDAPRSVKHAAAVAHSTKDFFTLVTEKVDLSRVLLVYTSDHGQNLENGAPHCSPNPTSEELSVPLVVVTAAPVLGKWLEDAVGRMRDHVSHANVFPSLLYTMGYDSAWAEVNYGQTLAGPVAPYLTLVGRPFPGRRASVVQFTRSERFPGR